MHMSINRADGHDDSRHLLAQRDDALIDGASRTTERGSVAVQQIRMQSIYIVHPSRLFRDCLKRSLKGAVGYVVRDFPDLDDLDESFDPGSLALLLLGVNLGSSNSARLDAILQQLGGEVPVVVTSDSEDPRLVAALLAKGVSGYIPTSMDLEVTIQALRLVLAGGVYAPASCLLKLWQSAQSPPEKSTAPETLTAKQMAVIEAIRKGKANKTIAYELNMCESTVKVHVRNIMKKLHAKNRTQVAYIANQLLSQFSQSGDTLDAD